ncbi:hypothetical protein F5B20DRAFT_547728 [Whalleya microplaca]|nr:hypothetical protein F5B20DRAFT_547728 [Whalleya microplaca]
MSRSRSGCITCRNRKRKCDETRPECDACTARGVRCEGYKVQLRWGNTVASRGRLAGATIPVITSPVGSEASSQPDSAPTDKSRHNGDPEHPGPRSAAASPLALTTTELAGGEIRPFEGGLHNPVLEKMFNKFLVIGLRRLYATKSGSWVETLIQVLSRDSPALFYVGVAIQMYLDEGLSVSCLEHVEHALQAFRQELRARSQTLAAATMGAGLLICSLYLLQGRPWTMLLQLMTELYHLDGDLSQLHPDPQYNLPVQHQLEVLAIMDMPSFVIGRVNPSIGLWRRFREAQTRWDQGKLRGVELVSGLPRSLLDIFAHITDDDRELETELWQWPGEIGEFLQCQLWECYRFAGVLRVRRRRLQEQSSQVYQAGQHPRLAAISNDQARYPATHYTDELVLCRLFSCMEALCYGMQRPECEPLLVFNAILYPLVEASLQVCLLRRHPEWVEVLKRVRNQFVTKQSSVMQVIHVLFSILDDAWISGVDGYDLEAAARHKGVEIAIF